MLWIRIAGISAILAAGVVAFGEAGSAATTSGKIFTDRLSEFADAGHPATTDRLAVAVAGSRSGGAGVKSSRLTHEALKCELEAWPYVSVECVASGGGTNASRPVRTITLEKRDAPATSVLVRVPQMTVAAG